MVRTWLNTDTSSKLRFVSGGDIQTNIDPWPKTRLLVKTIGREPDATPICANDTQHGLVMLICRITTERSRGEECQLTYKYGHDFNNSCDSRFTLMTENQTVFLHLTSLTPEDSGNYSCQCANSGGTFKLHINITVEGDESISRSTEIPFPYVGVGVIIFLIITGGVLGLIYGKLHNGRQLEPMTSHATMVLYTKMLEPGDIEPYSTFIQKENELYSVAMMYRNT
ncbi:uncharacterized protein LOC111665286 isoform X3 [Seriola lalandi dorsalis]|uniref:uncharacterized protein LOC111665286 isoform X3 n=1 Tax=Seriola lalandi dorsalis TaxID=1841481 RepID=UPI000C6F71A9|nr:uncharacterized protein LOC111665286 isoform X3 [Seriola lalandi dorsalis]